MGLHVELRSTNSDVRQLAAALSRDGADRSASSPLCQDLRPAYMRHKGL